MKCNTDEFKKYYNLVKRKQCTLVIAAKALGYKYQYLPFLFKKYEKEGDKIFIHGLKGKKSNNALPDEEKQFIIDYYKQENAENDILNFQVYTEEINEIRRSQDKKSISYSTVYDILTSAGIHPPTEHNSLTKPSVHRKSFRRNYFGEMLQWGATNPYQWFLFNGDKNYYTIHGVLDDATSQILALYMCEKNCLYGYIACRKIICEKYGLEIEDYANKTPIFADDYEKKTDSFWKMIDKELNIKLTVANSSLGTGKIKRTWQTVKGRLPYKLKEKKLLGSDLHSVNDFLNMEFIPYLNTALKKQNKSGISVFRKIPEAINLENILCVKFLRLVHYDWTVNFKGRKLKVLQIKPNVQGEVCVNEKEFFFLYKNKRYEVQIIDCSILEADSFMKEIIDEYMFSSIYK